MAVATELQQLLSLADCRFVREPPSGKGARIESDGTVRLNHLVWPSSVVGLPTRSRVPRSIGGPCLWHLLDDSHSGGADIPRQLSPGCRPYRPARAGDVDPLGRGVLAPIPRSVGTSILKPPEVVEVAGLKRGSPSIFYETVEALDRMDDPINEGHEE